MTETSIETAGNGISLEAIEQFLAQEGWPFERIGDQQLLRTGFQGEKGTFTCFAHCRPEFNQCVFYSVAPVRAPEVLRPGVVEYLTRANWGLIVGNFELDYSDGEIRFRTGLQLSKGALTSDLLRPLIFGNVTAMDKYLPGIQAVIALTQTPSSAIATVEAE